MSNINPMQNLHIATKCPMCDSAYDQDDIKIIGKKNGTLSVYLNCKHCKSSIIVFVLMNQAGVTSVSVPTDITEEDFEKIRKNKAISYDDVLEMYKFLQNN